MTSIARALRITGGSLGLILLVLTAGPHSVARAQHGAQIQKTCVNATRFSCLQGTTFGCPGINAGDACRTAADCPGGGLQTVCVGGRTTAGMPCDPENPSECETGLCTAAICVGGPNGGTPCTSADQCPGGECTPCVPIPIANVGEPLVCTITVISVDPVDRIRLDTITDEITSRSPIVPTPNLLPGFGFCRPSATPGIAGRMCTMNDQCPGSSCSIGSTCEGGIEAGLPCPTRSDCPDGTCFDCRGGVCRVSPHCELDPNKLCMSQDDCAPTASGPCVVVLGQLGDQVNVPLHPHCSETASEFCMTDAECRPPMCTICAPSETCVGPDLTVLASDANPLTDLARAAGLDEGTLRPVPLTFPGNVCIPPCAGSAHTCNGTCPSGESCVATPSGCVCELPCASTSPPTCGGSCPTGQSCVATPSGCVCELPCASTSPPMCNGTCPTGESCVATPSGCVCELPCASTSPPTCNGTCPTGQSCVATPSGCVCELPCASTSPPTCNGSCPTGQSCVATPSGCVCQTPCANSAPACNGTCPDAQVCVSTDGGCICQAAGCRITGGGAIAGGGVDPTVMAETSVLTEFAGQIGAPCGCFGCFDNFDPKRASVQGEWKYKLKKHGGSLHASIFNSLVCSCLGGSVGSFCPSAEHPRTPADHICVTGIADLSPDVGNSKKTTPVAFRFEATDNGEPGTDD